MSSTSSVQKLFEELTGDTSVQQVVPPSKSVKDEFEELTGSVEEPTKQPPLQAPATVPVAAALTGSQLPERFISALPKGTIPEKLPMPKYTGNYADEYISQFMNNVAEGVTSGLYEAPPAAGLPGETAVRVAGKVAGSALPLGVGAKVIGAAIRGAATKLPRYAKLIYTLSRGVFTEEAVRGAINNSVDFYNALKSGDMEALEDAAAFAVIDTAFAGLMAKGWVDDAKQLKALRDQMMADRFARARNITPEPPKQLPPATLTEAKTQATAPAPAPPPPPEPSVELKAAADAKDLTAETAKKVIAAKVKRAPETEEVRKARMAKAREAKAAKVVAEKPTKITKPQQAKIEKVKKLVDLGYDDGQISFKLNISEKDVAELKAGRVPVVEKKEEVKPAVLDIRDKHHRYKAIAEMAQVSGGGTRAPAIADAAHLFTPEERTRLTDYFDNISPDKRATVEEVAREANISSLVDFNKKEVGVVPIKTVEPEWPPKTPEAQAAAAQAIAEAAPSKGELIAQAKAPAEEFEALTGAKPAEPTDLMVTADDISAAEAHFGRDLDEISETEMAEFMSQRKNAPESLTPVVVEPVVTEESPIEKHFGKPIDQITEAEIDEFFKLEKADIEAGVMPEQLTEVDTQTGSPEPEIMSGEETVFDADPEAIKARSLVYDKNKLIASSVDEALASGLIVSPKDIAATGWKLANDVNRWKIGEEVDIEATRNFLSEIAGRADEFIGQFESTADFLEWKETAQEMAAWARQTGRLKIDRTGGTSLYSGLPIDEIVRRLGKVHPATYPRTIQKAFASVASKLGITDVLDIFAGVGKIGRIKEYGYKGKVRANEIEPKWGGQSTKKLQREHGVDEVTIGDARELPHKDNSVQAIMTSPTYGNLMALRSPSKIDSYQSLAGGRLREGNTGGEVWGPEYEKLHREAYREAYRVVKPGGFFILNMKDKPVTAAEAKNNWIPKRGSTVEVVDGVMKATDWHVRALQEAGFEFISSTEVEEAKAIGMEHRYTRRFTTGKEYVVVMGKPDKLGGVSLYSGFPLDELARVISARMKIAKAFFDETARTRKLKGIDFAKVMKELKVDSVQMLIDQSETLLKHIRQMYPQEAQRIIDRQRSAATGRGYGTALYEQAIREIFGGLSDEMVNTVNDYVLARRLKDIYSYKPEYRAQPGYGEDEATNTVALFESLKGMDEGALKVLRRRSPEFEKKFGKLSAKQIDDVIRRAETLFEWSRKIVDDLVKWGIKTEEEGKLLKAHDFRKFKTMTVEQLYDLTYTTKLGNETIKATNSGVESLGHGSSRIIDPDARISLHEMFMRAYGAIANQAAKQQWERLAIDHPENGFVMVSPMHNIPEGWRPIKGMTGKKVYVDPVIVEKLSPGTKHVSKKASKVLAEYYAKNPESPFFRVKGEQVPSGWSEMPMYVNGELRNIYFHPDAAKWLVTRSHDLSKRFTQVLKVISMAPITRALAVGTSPAWSTFVGLPMDVMHTLWTARTWESDKTGVRFKPTFPFVETTEGGFKKVYSKFDPLAEVKLGTDMARTFRDVYTRGPLFMNLMKHGLAMPFLAMRQGKYLKGVSPPGDWAKAMDLISYHGTSMEMWVRAAVADRVIRNKAAQKGMTYKEALKNDDIMYEAVHAARDRMDYNQGGWLIKALDQSGLIFLNAGVLGARTFFRQAKDNPVDFTFGMLRMGIIAAGVAATAWTLYEDIMKEVPNEGNEKNMVFPLFPGQISFTDRDGNIRHFYMKLRMDPNAAFMYKVFDALTRTYLFDRGLIQQEPDYGELVRNLKQLGPVGVSAPPAIQGWYDYVTNYSYWKDRQMYTDLQGRKLSWPDSRHEGAFDPNVPQAAKDIGKVTGLSPKRLSGAITNVLPQNNEFVYLFGKAYEEAFSDVPKEVRKEHWLMTLAELPGVNRIIGVTQPGYDRRKTKESVQKELDVRDVIRDGKFEAMVMEHAWYGARPLEDVTKFIAEQGDPDVAKEMQGKLKFAEKSKDLPNRSIWLSMYNMSVEGKAKELVRTLDSSSDARRTQILYELGHVRAISGEDSGYNSEKFIKEISKYATEKGMTPEKAGSLFEMMIRKEAPAQIQ